MPKKYNRDYLVAEFRKRLADKGESHIYDATFITRTGLVQGEMTPYSEFYAETVMAELDFNRIGQLRNVKTYWPHDREKTGPAPHNPASDRWEEMLGRKWFYEKKDLGEIGDVVEYQVPLGSGKVDLVTCDKNQDLHLIEFKYGKNTEPLVRAVLELATYQRQIDLARFVQEAKEKLSLRNEPKILFDVLLVCQGTNRPEALKALDDLEGHKAVWKLCKNLGIQVRQITRFVEDPVQP